MCNQAMDFTKELSILFFSFYQGCLFAMLHPVTLQTTQYITFRLLVHENYLTLQNLCCTLHYKS